MYHICAVSPGAYLREKGTWIVKPVASSRGRGIFLVSHVRLYIDQSSSISTSCLLHI